MNRSRKRLLRVLRFYYRIIKMKNNTFQNNKYRDSVTYKIIKFNYKIINLIKKIQGFLYLRYYKKNFGLEEEDWISFSYDPRNKERDEWECEGYLLFDYLNNRYLVKYENINKKKYGLTCFLEEIANFKKIQIECDTAPISISQYMRE